MTTRIAIIAGLALAGCADSDETAVQTDDVVVLPDLVVSAIVAPSSARPWDAFDVSVTLCNIGTVYIGSADANIHLSSGTAPLPGDPLLGSVFTPGLDAGQCSTEVQTVSAPGVPDGPYYVTAVADPSNGLVEDNELNNVGASEIIGIGFRPDLVVTAIDAPPSAHGAFLVDVTVCNVGTEPSFFNDVALIQSADQVIESYLTNPMTLDIPVGFASYGSLYPGDCETQNIQANAGPGNGAFYLGTILDEADNVLELVESNNITVGDLIGIGWGPDLIVESIDAPPTANGGFDATIRVCNQGTDWASGADVQLYVSADEIIETFTQNPMSPDLLLGSVYLPNTLYAGTCQNVVGNFNAQASPDALFLGAVVDEANATIELIESNNTFVGDRIGLGAGPDLYVRTIDAPPSANGNFDARVEVCNQGDSFVSGSDVSLYASTDATITSAFPGPGGDFLLGTGAISFLAPTECRYFDVQANAFLQGAYYVGTIVDDFNNLVELNEFNNVTVDGLMGFGIGVDVVVVSIDAPPSGDGAIDLAVGICNFGTAAANGTQVDLYVSADTTIVVGPTSTDFPIASHYSNYLAAGDCEIANVQGNVIGGVSPQYLAAVVDPYDSQIELIESNNTFIGPQIGTGSGPDLVIRDISEPSNNSNGFEVDVTVCNDGTIPMTGAMLTVLLSDDDEIAPSSPTVPQLDLPVANLNVSFLDRGECEVLNVSANSPGITPQYIGAMVDEYNNVIELREDNNLRVGGQVGAGQQPDLVIHSIDAPPFLDGSSDLDILVCNRGSVPVTNVNVDVILSQDQNLSTGFPFFDLQLGVASLPELHAGECRIAVAPIASPGIGESWYLGAIVDPYGSTPEMLESNNEYIHPTRFNAGSGSDLVVTNIDAPPTSNGVMDVDVTVCNHGSVSTSSSDIELRQSALPEFSDGMLLTNWPVPSLAAGGCSTQTLNVPAFASGHIIATVDSFDGILEMNEENNRTVGDLVVIGTGPDFVVTSLDAPPNVDGPFSLSWTVCNQGTAPGNTTVALVASTNDIITDFDFILDYISVTAAAGDCVSGVSAATSTGQGPHYLGGIVQPTGGDIRTDNDRFVGGIIGFGIGPDLVVDALVAPPTALGPIDVDYTICNQGTAASAPVNGEVHLLTHPMSVGIFDHVSAGNFAWVSVPSLAAGACTSGTATVPVLTPGAYYVAGLVDRHDGQPELREENNVLVGDVVGIGSGADLIANVVDVPPYAVPGAPVDVTTTICNQGTTASSPNSAMIYLSTDTTIVTQSANPSGADYQLNTVNIPALLPGQCDSAVTPTWPPGVSGLHFVGVVVDEYNSEVELLEENNTTVSSVIDFTPVFCGNGIIDSMTEQCDDGNFVDGDGCSAACVTEQFVWGANANGTLRNGPYRWNYAMGYHFTPNVDGVVSALGGYFHGTKTVRLFNRDTGDLLAQTTVTGGAPNGGFGYTDIAAVQVTAGTRYTVAAYIAGSGGTYRRRPARFPQTYGDVTIDAATYVFTGSIADRRPTNRITYTMYGQADIRFTPSL